MQSFYPRSLPCVEGLINENEYHATSLRGWLVNHHEVVPGSESVTLPDSGAVEAFAFSTIPPPEFDTDSATIDDRLEIGFFGDLTTASLTSDTDKDGLLAEIAQLSP